VSAWPSTTDALIRVQEELARADPPPWSPPAGSVTIGGVFVCFERGESGPGKEGDRAWAGAAVPGRASAVVTGAAGAAYGAGLLALREGALLEAAVRALAEPPEVLLVDATGRDHPRRAGLALHLGAVLDLPTVGVTHRPLLAVGEWPEDERGAHSALHLDGELVGHWLRTRTGTRPLAVHAAWRTDPEAALAVVRVALGRTRAPEPLREARRLARTRRAADRFT
jgi:deoxyribonuclease V